MKVFEFAGWFSTRRTAVAYVNVLYQTYTSFHMPKFRHGTAHSLQQNLYHCTPGAHVYVWGILQVGFKLGWDVCDILWKDGNEVTKDERKNGSDSRDFFAEYVHVGGRWNCKLCSRARAVGYAVGCCGRGVGQICRPILNVPLTWNLSPLFAYIRISHRDTCTFIELYPPAPAHRNTAHVDAPHPGPDGTFACQVGARRQVECIANAQDTICNTSSNDVATQQCHMSPFAHMSHFSRAKGQPPRPRARATNVACSCHQG